MPSSAIDLLHTKGKESYQATLDEVLRRTEEDEITQKDVREIIRQRTGRIPAPDFLPSGLKAFASDVRVAPEAADALKPIAAFPVYHEAVRKLKLLQGAGIELTPEKVAGAVKSSISCDYEALRSLNLGAPPQECHERWRHFDSAGCRKCEKPGHVKLEGENAPDDEFCVDHDCYRIKLSEALERLEVEREAKREPKEAPPPTRSPLAGSPFAELEEAPEPDSTQKCHVLSCTNETLPGSHWCEFHQTKEGRERLNEHHRWNCRASSGFCYSWTASKDELEDIQKMVRHLFVEGTGGSPKAHEDALRRVCRSIREGGDTWGLLQKLFSKEGA